MPLDCIDILNDIVVSLQQAHSFFVEMFAAEI